MSLITKCGSGGKIWDWYLIPHYFVEYLTPVMSLGPRQYYMDLKMWEKLESNLPVFLTVRNKQEKSEGKGEAIFDNPFLIQSMKHKKT